MIDLRAPRVVFPQPYKQLTDEKVREITKTSMASSNGEYANTVCRRCGTFWSDANSYTDRAKIIGLCQECFDVSETDLMTILSGQTA